MDEIEIAKLFDWKNWQFLTPNAVCCYLLGSLFSYAFGPKDEKYEKWAKPLVATMIVVLIVYNAAKK